MKMTDSEKAQLRDRFGHQAFVILTASLVLGEGLAMLWDGVESFPRVLGALCLAGGYYLARCIWAGVYFRPGESPAAWALALAGGGGIAVWRLAGCLGSAGQRDWNAVVAWAEFLCFCLLLLAELGFSYLREQKSKDSGRRK